MSNLDQAFIKAYGRESTAESAPKKRPTTIRDRAAMNRLAQPTPALDEMYAEGQLYRVDGAAESETESAVPAPHAHFAPSRTARRPPRGAPAEPPADEPVAERKSAPKSKRTARPAPPRTAPPPEPIEEPADEPEAYAESEQVQVRTADSFAWQSVNVVSNDWDLPATEIANPYVDEEALAEAAEPVAKTVTRKLPAKLAKPLKAPARRPVEPEPVVEDAEAVEEETAAAEEFFEEPPAPVVAKAPAKSVRAPTKAPARPPVEPIAEPVPEPIPQPVPEPAPVATQPTSAPVVRINAPPQSVDAEEKRRVRQEILEREQALQTLAKRQFQAAWEVDRFSWPEPCLKLCEAERSYFAEAGENLLQATREGMNVLAITSAQRGEGRTTLALCLARSAALAGNRVALVDADIENAQLARVLGIDLAVGWQDAVEEEKPLDEAGVQSMEDHVTLFPLSRTAWRKGLKLQDARTVKVLRAIAEQFDLVIVDLGPLGPESVADRDRIFGSIPCPLDAAIVVRDLRMTSQRQSLATAERLRASGVQTVGIAENFGGAEQ